MIENSRQQYSGTYSQYLLIIDEVYDDIGSRIFLNTNNQNVNLNKFTWAQIDLLQHKKIPTERLFCGCTAAEILSHGKDVLGEPILAMGEPTPESVNGLLPPITKNGFSFLSGQSSWYGVIVEQNGDLRAQPHRGTKKQLFLFQPNKFDKILGSIIPTQVLLDGDLPIIISIHTGEKKSLEFIQFVEPGDTSSNPVVWIRAQYFDNSTHSVLGESLFICGLELESQQSTVSQEDFWDAFTTTVLHWTNYRSSISDISLSDENMLTSVRGCMIALATTLSSDHPHYGHGCYGWEIHDHFPPTFLTSMEACVSLGLLEYARRQLEHILIHSIDQSGRFYYRQGERHMHGASASEYGQLLWLVERYSNVLPPQGWITGHLDTLCNIGNMLIRNRLPSQTHNDLNLIFMCAEADTNGRIYDYVQNNFWSARGLTALGDLLSYNGRIDEGTEFRIKAEELLHDVKTAVAREQVITKFGPLPPFQLGYTATPLTLSNCRDTFTPVDNDTYASYLQRTDVRSPIKGTQDYVENTYANYRYYLEMLSSRCLEESEELSLVHMRETLGGELLGMTRFLDRLDDWPVFNYARFLLETDRLNKYLLLLYAHTQYHGLPHLMCYYEQYSIDGAVIAPDCVPSLMITPLMVSWMLVFEPVKEKALFILRGVPSYWLKTELSFNNIFTRWGAVSLSTENILDGINITLTLPIIPQNVPVYLDVRISDNIYVDSDMVASIDGNRLLLVPGVRTTQFFVKNA